MVGGKAEMIGNKGCSSIFFSTPSPRHLACITTKKNSDFMSSSPSNILGSPGLSKMAPFDDLVVCVTGLSNEARQQIMATVEKLGGQYSSSLHPRCTHLVVQSCFGRKFEHAMKHGQSNGLFVVTLDWFIDSALKKERLNESLYQIKSTGKYGFPSVEFDGFFGRPERSCLPSTHAGADKSSNLINNTRRLLQEPSKKDLNKGSVFCNDFIFIDPDVSNELKKKVVDTVTREGVKFVDFWLIDSPASYIICESNSIQKYIGHADSLVTPLWFLKTVKEKRLQRLMHLSSDLARQVSMILENNQINRLGQDSNEGLCQIVLHSSNFHHGKVQDSLEDRQKYIEFAKQGVRKRRTLSMHSCQRPFHPITPISLLESVCWSVSEPTSTATIFTELPEIDDQNLVFIDSRDDRRESEASIESFSKPLRESERSEVIFKNHFLTILFPIDRFGELGPFSRTFFSDGGFTCLQILEHIYKFYQESPSADEVEVAIHTDSRHADRLRSLYASKEAMENGFVFQRMDLLGSRRNFEVLKRINGQNNSSCYELLLRA